MKSRNRSGISGNTTGGRWNRSGRVRGFAAFVGVLMAVLLCATACETAPEKSASDDGVLCIVCTTYAAYDFARTLTENAEKGTVEIAFLGKAGQDMHSFEPSAADILTIGRADILVDGGGVSEVWMDHALHAAQNESVTRVTMMRVCDTLNESPTEGMDTAGHHDHDHEHEGTDSTLINGDEHVWLSLVNAKNIVQALRDALIQTDSARTELWKTNAASYLSELTALETSYRSLMESAKRKTIVIADRYPFAYLVRDLGLTCYAAFPGCSSETSASFATQTFLIEKTRELSLPVVFMIEGSDGKVAHAVAAESGAEVIVLDSLQVVTDTETTYLSAMTHNLEALKKALL